MKIQDLESKTGLDRTTIRYYEKQGLINPARQENGYRDYSAEDCGNLLKIKLLRQLEFPLEQIREFQQGSVDFSAAMEAQIHLLEEKITTMGQAKKVCQTLRDDKVSYSTLNAVTYLALLNKPEQQNPFREDVKREVQPVRRFIARTIDWAIILLLLNWIFYSVIRIRPDRDIYSYLITAAGLLVSIFTEAVMVYLLGTTPGKWLTGIRVESPNGGKLTYEESMWRARLVTQYGVGFRIPIWREIKHILAYKACMEGKLLEWEEDSELQYKSWGSIGKFAVAFLYILLILGLSFVTLDASYLPSNRGQLTIAEFAENYNGYAREGGMLDPANKKPELDEDGTWDAISFVYVGYGRADFIYHCDDVGNITGIEYKDRYAYVEETCDLITHAFVGAQSNINLFDMIRFNAQQIITNQIDRPILNGETTGEIQIENVYINWTYDNPTDMLTYVISIEKNNNT